MNKYSPQKEEAEIRTLLSIIVDDIRYAKNRQWSTTYYVLLTHAALIGFSNLIENNLLIAQVIIIIPAIWISYIGISNLLDTHMRLSIYRIRLTKIQDYLSEEPKRIINIRPEKDEKKYTDYGRYFKELTMPFIIVLLFGLLFVIGYVFTNTDYTIGLIIILFICCLIFIIDRCSKDKMKVNSLR